MINQSNKITERVHWKTLTILEKNILIHEKALGLTLLGAPAQQWLQELQTMRLPMPEGTRRIHEEDSPLNYVPNYVGEKAKAREAAHQFFERKDIDTLIASALGGVFAEEARQLLIAACSSLRTA